jgi:hypothetical protein
MSTRPEEKRAKRSDVLPHSLPPRVLSRAESAPYIGVSPSTFDTLFAENLMPGPKRLKIAGFGTENGLTSVSTL